MIGYATKLLLITFIKYHRDQYKINSHKINFALWAQSLTNANNSAIKSTIPKHNTLSANHVMHANIQEKDWVRKIQMNNAQKIVLVKKTQKQDEKFFYYMHDGSNYQKGVVYSGGSFYEGDISRDHTATGKGVERFLKQANTIDDCEGSYDGEFKDNARHGKGVYRDNFIKFDGQWKNGYPTKGTLQKLKLGSQQSAIYKLILIQFNNSSLSSGICSLVLPDGSLYKGEFVNKNSNQYVMQGKGNLTMPNQQVYDGDFDDGKFHGQGSYTCKTNNQKFQGQYINGMKHGMGKLYIDPGYCLSGKWVQGKKSGKFQLNRILSDGTQLKIKDLQFETIVQPEIKTHKKLK